MKKQDYNSILSKVINGTNMLAILVDPEKFEPQNAARFLAKIPLATTHIFVGGSTGDFDVTSKVVIALKAKTKLPVVLFPGNYKQLVPQADAVLFLSLLSGRNPEFLINQQVKAIPFLKQYPMEVIPTGYILIDGGTKTAVERISNTKPLSQIAIEVIVDTAIAGQYMGAKLIYLEAGSGATIPVNKKVIAAVKKQISIPLVVGGGVKTNKQKQEAYSAGADMVVMGTVFEK